MDFCERFQGLIILKQHSLGQEERRKHFKWIRQTISFLSCIDVWNDWGTIDIRSAEGDYSSILEPKTTLEPGMSSKSSTDVWKLLDEYAAWPMPDLWGFKKSRLNKGVSEFSFLSREK